MVEQIVSPLSPSPCLIVFFVDLVKRDSPTSMSNLHHQTANASTNTPIHESLCLSPFFLGSSGNKSPSAELASMKLASLVSSSTASLNSSSKLASKQLPVSTVDHSPFNFLSDSPGSTEKTKIVLVGFVLSLSLSLTSDKFIHRGILLGQQSFASNIGHVSLLSLSLS